MKVAVSACGPRRSPICCRIRARNTYEANVALGLPEESRDFSDAAVLLRYFLFRPAAEASCPTIRTSARSWRITARP